MMGAKEIFCNPILRGEIVIFGLVISRPNMMGVDAIHKDVI